MNILTIIAVMILVGSACVRMVRYLLDAENNMMKFIWSVVELLSLAFLLNLF
jgi:hypothetical protein